MSEDSAPAAAGPVLEGAAAQAVAHRGTHVQIIASAGSGKTEVVSQRVAALVADGEPAASIVAFTFTERAAAELKERIRQRVETRLGPDAVDRLGALFVGTIHAYCFRLLQTFVPRYESYDVLDENQLVGFLQREGNRLGIKALDPKQRLFAAVGRFAQNADVVENELIDPAGLDEGPFHDVLLRYYDALERYRLLTYGQQIVRAVRALEDPEVHARVTHTLRHLIVDEYQDVNPAQERLIQLLSKPVGSADLVVVGDDDQAIYQWRGSDVSNIVSFSTRYEGVHQFELTSNRRSRPAIVALADAFAQTIPGRLPKTMEAVRESVGPAVDVVPDLATEAEEAEEIALTIQRLHVDGVAFRDIAVLVRGRSAYPRLLESFEAFGIPVQPGGRTGLFAQPEADLLGRTYAWLSNIDWRSTRYAATESVDQSSLVARYRAVFALSEEQSSLIMSHLTLWKAGVGDESQPVDLVGDFYGLITLLGPTGWDVTEDSVRNRLGTLARFTTVLADYETVRRRARPDRDNPGEQVGGEDRGKWYYFGLAILLTNYANGSYEDFDGEPDVATDAVDLLTVHSAKGLEWPIVFLPSLTKGRFPSSKTGSAGNWLVPRRLFDASRYEGSDADERRLFYVALTRARDWVSLSAHEVVTSNRVPPSPYITFCVENLTEPAALPRIDVMYPAAGTPDILVTYSELASFLDCAHSYWLRSRLGFMPALAPELGYGKAVHHLMRLVAEYTQRNGRPPKPRDVDHMLSTDFYLPMANKPAHRQMREAARRLVYHYVRDHGEELTRVWATERPFELTLHGVVVSGRADVIFDDHDGVPANLAIVDYKTSTGDSDHGLQLQVYADAGRREGLDVAAAYVHDLGKTERIPITVGPSDIIGAEQVVIKAAERLRQRDFAPSPGAARCGRCDVRSLCRDAFKA